jgi:sulfite dehydrogenase (cytochrome) subunit B
MIRAALMACLLAPLSALAAEPADLKPGPDVDLVTATCGMCHTPRYIPMNSRFLTRDGWAAEVTKMRTAFGAPIDDESAGTIIKYLSQTYAAPPKS